MGIVKYTQKLKERYLALKIALITGVSGGIGKATAKKFIDNGYFVIGQYNLNKKSIDDFYLELEKENKNFQFFAIKCDLSDSKDIANMMDTIEKSFKHLDVLVNNAGISLTKLITDTTLEEWDKIFSINLKSAYLITNRVLKGMIDKKQGKIVNISSMWGVTGASMEVAYSTTKAGLIGYTKALAKEVGQSNVNVNCVCPGVIDTPMNAHLSADDINELKEQTPLNSIGKPMDVANLIYFLCSDEASFITGQVVSVDGGFIV